MATGAGLTRFTAQRRRRSRPVWHALRRDRRGATAIEFALLAMPLILMLFGILELGLIFVANTCLSNATLALARQIRVGQIVASGVASSSSSGKQLNLNDFKAAICASIKIVPASTCMSQLQVDVRTQSSFQNQVSPSPLASSNFTTSSLCFYSGTPGSVVSMRAYYLWNVLTPMLYPFLTTAKSVTTSGGTTTGNFFVLTSAEIFKNEPNAGTTNSGAGC